MHLKKIIFIAILASSSLIVNAQLSKGNFLIGLGVSNNNLNLKTPDFTADIAYLFKDKWSVGLTGNINLIKGNTTIEKPTEYSLGVEIQNFFISNNKISSFLSGGFGLGKNVEWLHDNQIYETKFKKQFSLGIGLNYWLNDKISLKAGIKNKLERFDIKMEFYQDFNIGLNFRI